MTSKIRSSVTKADIEAYQRDGAVVLRQRFEPHEIDLLRTGDDANLAHPSPPAKVASRPDDPCWWRDDVR